MPVMRETPVYSSTTSRPWKKLDPVTFRSALAASPLCDSDVWSALDLNGMAQLYDTEITSILDHLTPVRTVRCRRRASDAWFDDDCRVAKRGVRLFERNLRRIRCADPLNTAAINTAATPWAQRRRKYRILHRHKCESFWRAK